VSAPFAKRHAMDYAFAMRARFLSVSSGIIFLLAGFWLRADEVQMQNGDRYFGNVLSVSTDAVVLESDVLGKITVSRKKVTSLAFGTNTLAPVATQIFASTNLPTAASLNKLAGTNANFSASPGNLDADTNVIQKIREQLLASSPEATAKYDEMVNGLFNGSLNIGDLRREAQSDADQLRALKRDLGPDAGDSLDGYLEVLDDFLNESNSAAESTQTPIVPQPKAQVH
jgi:hypothetical protein